VVKAVVVAIPALTAAGLLWVAREVHGRVPPTALFALPFAFNYPFLFGFVNFALAMALALLAFRFVAAARAAGALAPAHRLVRAHLLSCCGSVTRSAGALCASWPFRPSWCAATTSPAICCTPAGAPASTASRSRRRFALMLAWRSKAGGETFDWFNWEAKFVWLQMMLRDRWAALDQTSLVVIVACCWRC
jgi:hypothetical protein